MIAGTESRQGLYVALSRGRHQNHLYLSDDEPAPDGFALELPADHGPREVLTRILDRDDRAESATRAMAADPAREVALAVQQYEDALPLLAAYVIGDARMAALDSSLDRWRPGLITQPGYPALRGQIALRWVNGESPGEIVKQATWWLNEEELEAAQDPASALARNVMRSGPTPVAIGSLSWLRAAPDSIREHLECGPCLDRMTVVITDLDAAANEPAGSPAELEIRLSAAQCQQDLRLPPPQAAGRRTPGLGR